VAITLPTYFAAIALYFNLTEPKLNKIIDVYRKRKSVHYKMIALIPDAIRASYRFAICTMVMALFSASMMYVVTMLLDKKFIVQPKIYVLTEVFLFLVSISTGLISIVQIVLLDKLCAKDGEKIIQTNDAYETIIKAINTQKANEDNSFNQESR
jgi:hypothetical protein